MSTAETLTNLVWFSLHALTKLVHAGRIMREYSQERSERYLDMSHKLVCKRILRDAVTIMDAKNDKAIEALGKEYCATRTRVAVVTVKKLTEKKREELLNNPELWFGDPIILGLVADVYNLNSGCHRSMALHLFLSDLQAQGIDIDPNTAEVRVQVNTGDAADRGTLSNDMREADKMLEKHDRLWGEYRKDTSEQRDMWANILKDEKGRKPTTMVQATFRIFRLALARFFTFGAFRAMKVTDLTDREGKKVSVNPKKLAGHKTELSEVAGLESLGAYMRDWYKASIRYASVAEENVPDDIKERFPFRMTYPRLWEVLNRIIWDSALAVKDKAIMATDADKRAKYAEVVSFYSQDGWAAQERKTKESTDTATGSKEIADRFRKVFADASEADKETAEILAKVIETGTIPPIVTDLVAQVNAPRLAPSDFYGAIDKAFPIKSQKKVTNAQANETAREAVAVTFAKADKA